MFLSAASEMLSATLVYGTIIYETTFSWNASVVLGVQFLITEDVQRSLMDLTILVNLAINTCTTVNDALNLKSIETCAATACIVSITFIDFNIIHPMPLKSEDWDELDSISEQN